MGFQEIITNVFTKAVSPVESTSVIAMGENRLDSIFKAYIPHFLYKPPYGYPRPVNTPQLKVIAKNPYIFSVIKTISDEITDTPWEIRVKPEFQDDGKDYSEDIDKATKFLKNPNGNAESFEQLLRQVITDILEVDSGVLVKVFNPLGELQQIFARDGSLFLKNPDIYGYMGDKADFVPPMPDGFDVSLTYENPNVMQQQMIKNYDAVFKSQAAYFQYGWTAGSMPVPFGKKEIIYFMQNPRADSIYGRSPLEVLYEIILTLIYGSEFNLDFYINNNMPEGIISLLGAKEPQIKDFRERFEAQFIANKDAFGKKRKQFFKFPITSAKPEFVPFQLNPKDMDIIAQQEWFMKLVWACFGVTAAEMGWTETVNKASAEQEVKASSRKAIQPLLKILSYNLNTQLIPEFYSGDWDKFSDIPIEIVFDYYDVEEDIKKHDLLEQEINMGVKTNLMAAEELGINVEELKKQQDEAAEKEQELAGGEDGIGSEDTGEGVEILNEEEEEEDVNIKDKREEKSLNSSEPVSPLKEIENYVDNVGKDLLSAIDMISDDEIRQPSV